MKEYSFGGLKNSDIGTSEIVILPLCYERNVSYGKGTDKGPLHILTASKQLEALDEETLTDWSNFKIHTIPPFYPSDNPENAVKEMEEKAFSVMSKGKFLLSLGGDHAISIGPVIAASKVYKKLGLLQIDAHLDLRDRWNKSKFNHACVIRRIIETTKTPVSQVGIRSVAKEEIDFCERNSLKPFYAHDIDPMDDSWMDEAIDILPENVYMTIDLDGLDPSVIPGTGTPEPGGLLYRQLTKLIKKISKKRNLIAADICELIKIDGQQVSEFTAAKIAMKLIVESQIQKNS
ncbi:MAG: agmatinase [Desulfobacterales bacterium]|nr:agmatinase [Desulfobacterales bacterium]MCP4163836.1 agmatinase [Deltaproteobacteria bacterium]